MFQKVEIKQPDFLGSHILGIQQDIKEIQKEANEARQLLDTMYKYSAPEITRPIREDIHNCMISIIAQEERVATLTKIKNGERITREELNHLLKMDMLAQCPYVTEYQNVEGSVASTPSQA